MIHFISHDASRPISWHNYVDWAINNAIKQCQKSSSQALVPNLASSHRGLTRVLKPLTTEHILFSHDWLVIGKRSWQWWISLSFIGDFNIMDVSYRKPYRLSVRPCETYTCSLLFTTNSHIIFSSYANDQCYVEPRDMGGILIFGKMRKNEKVWF